MSHRVTLQENGEYWLARWRDEDGRTRSKSLGNRSKVTRRDALAACLDLERTFMATPGMKKGGRSPTLKQWTDKYVEIRADEVSDGTLELDRDTIAYLTKHFGADRKLRDITEANADDWRRWMGKQPSKAKVDDAGTPIPLSPHTVASHVRRAKCLFERARKRKVIPTNPFADVSTAAPRIAKDWADISLDDLDRILDQCPSAAWRNLFAVCRLAGLRLGEAKRLTWRDVDWDEHTIRVWPPKREGRAIETTKVRARVVPIEPRLNAILRESFESARADDECPCWTGGDLYRRAKPILERAGIAIYPKLFHTLRKCRESEWMTKYPGQVVCEWMGHSPSVAATHYVRPTADVMRAVTGGTDPLAEAQAEIARLKAMLIEQGVKA